MQIGVVFVYDGMHSLQFVARKQTKYLQLVKHKIVLLISNSI